MKILISLILLTASFQAFSQEMETVLKKVRSVEQANNFIEENSNFEGAVVSFSSDKDSSDLFNTLYRQKYGALLEIDGYTYKIVEKRNSYLVRASDIYLDGNRISKPKIDSIRSVIILKYTNGTPYEDLIKQYNMDAEGGDLGWIAEGTMAKEFETAVRDHLKGEIFSVDVPVSRWYYVAIKTADTKDVRVLSAIKIRNREG